LACRKDYSAVLLPLHRNYHHDVLNVVGRFDIGRAADYRKASAADMATFRPERRTRIAISASFIDDMTMMVFATSHV
jgi:hypothetical protein